MEPKKQHKVLVIEDEPVFRAGMVGHLRASGDLVYEVDNGAAGLAAVALYRPDLVLCDLNMPGMDGHEVIDCISRRFPSLPVMVVSGLANLGDVTQALRAGARDYVFKPIRDWRAFRQAMQNCLLSAAEQQAYQELTEHLSHFGGDDLAASHLLQGMAPPRQQRLGNWELQYESDSPLLMPEFFKLDEEHLLLVTLELSLLDSNATFLGAMVKFLLHGPYRQYRKGESQLLNSPGQVLSYLNWHLCDSGLKGCLNTAALLFSAKEGAVRYANAGLGSPYWLHQVEGLPLGLARQSEYVTHQRPACLPFKLDIRGESGACLSIDLRQHP